MATAAPLSPEDLLHDIHVAIADGAPGYVIPPGTYFFNASTLATMSLNGPLAQPFNLSGYGATLVFPPKGGGVAITNTVGLSLSGVTIDYSPLAFTQGAASELKYFPPSHSEPDPTVTFLLTVDDGYLSPAAIGAMSYSKVYFWSAADRTFYHSQVETSPVLVNASEVSPGVWRIFSHFPDALGTWQPPAEGTLATVSATVGTAVLCTNCTDTLVQDVTVYASPGMGYLEASGGGGTIIRRWAAVRPPPSHPIAPTNRLLVTTIDGVHSTSVERGLSLLDSEVSFAGDDLFAVHCELGLAWGVPSAAGCDTASADAGSGSGNATDTLWLIDTGGNAARTVAQVQPGEELFFFSFNTTMDPLGALTVASIAVEPNATLQAQAANATEDIRRALGYIVRPLTGQTLLLRVQFTQPVPAVLQRRWSSLMQYQGRCGRGTTVQGTHLHDGTGGMRLKGVDVTVSNSTVASAYGMRMLPEVFWTQSVSFNISIVDNLLNNTGNAPAQAESIAYYNDTCTGLQLRGNTIIPAPNVTAAA